MTVLEQGAFHRPPYGVRALPLCVDLDGTLTYSDTLLEGIAAQLFDPRLLRAFLKLPFTGRAVFKQTIAANAPIDARLLPYNPLLLDYLKREKRKGRYLVLATAANGRIAQAVADHLGLFDEIIASDGVRNLKGRAKADALQTRFGKRGFVYAGNEASDIAIWDRSGGAILVNSTPAIARHVYATNAVEGMFPGHPAAQWPLLRAMRPHQWVKNLLVFIPIFTAHAVGEGAAWIAGLFAFAAFCATASAIYLVNDATDLGADRAHARKRFRPYASGALKLSAGLTAAALLGIAGCGLAIAGGILPIIAAYAAMSMAYCLKLKELPLVDVFLLAALYTIRLFGGGEASGHELSLWLLAFSGFLFLGLALLKRVAELSATGQTRAAAPGRRGYTAADMAILRTLGCAASFSSSMVLALFVQWEATTARYASPALLWGTVPVMLFWQCRLWLSTARGYMHDDPILYSARDWVSWLAGAAVILLLLSAYSIPL